MAGNSAIVGELRGILGLDTAQWEEGLASARAGLAKFGKELTEFDVGRALRAGVRDAEEALQELGGELGVAGKLLGKMGLGGVALAAGIGGAAVAFEGLRKSLESADELGKLAQKIGIPVEELSKLKYAGDLADVSMEQLGVGAKKLSVNMAEVAKGGAGGPAADAFRALGIQAKNADGSLRPVSEVIADVAGKFGNMQDGAVKTATAVALFGKSGSDMIPLLNEGKAGLEELFQEAGKFGQVLNDKTTKNAEAFNDNMRRLGLATKGAGLSIAAELAPAMADISGIMVEAAKNTELMHTTAELLTLALKGVATAAVAVGAGLVGIFQLGKGAVQVTGDLLKGQFGQALKDNAATGRAVIGTVAGAAGAIGTIWTGKGGVQEGGASRGSPPALTRVDPGAAAKAAAVRAASEQAVDAATKDELAARMGLVKDIDTLARLKLDQIDAETRQKNDKLQEQAAQGKITAAAAATASALNNKAAVEKKAAVASDAEAQIIEQAVQQRQRIAGYYDRIAGIQASIATSTTQLNAIEAKALNDRQREERQNLEDAQAAERARAENDAARLEQLKSSQAAERAALSDQQAAEQRQQLQQQAVRLIQEQNANDEASLQRRIGLLQSTQDLASSDYERAQIAKRLLPLEQELERLKLEEIASNTSLDDAVRKRAAADLEVLKEVQANQRKLATSNAKFLNGLADTAGAFGQLGDAIRQHDWGSILTSAAGAFNQLAGLAGSQSGVGKGLAGLAKVLGPIGGIVTGVTGILGALFGGKNTVIGEAHLSAADQLKLQGSGTVLSSFAEQSQSVANALAFAEKYQNEDLQYSSLQTDFLRRISSDIGDLTGALGSQLGLPGSALDTTKLGLGQTGSKGILGVIGASSTTTSLVDEGINIAMGSLQDFVQGVIRGNYYQDVQKVTTKSGFLGIGGGTTTVNSELTSQVAPDVLAQVQAVVTSLQSGVLQAAGVLGADGAKAALDAFTVNIGRISLDGLSADQVTAQLNAVFSKLGDQIAAAALPALNDFQKAGEGAFETLERLATEYTTVDTALTSIGLTFQGVGLESLAARDRLVQLTGGLDAFTSETSTYAQDFLTDAQRIAPVQKSVTDAMAALGYASVTTKAQFVDLVDGLDVSTEAGAELYAKLLQIAPAFAKVADFADAQAAAQADLAKKRTDLMVQLLQQQGKAEDALALQRKAILDGTDATLVALQQQVFDTQDASDALATANGKVSDAIQSSISSLTQAQQKWQSLSDSLSDFAAGLATSTLAPADATRLLGAKFDALVTSQNPDDLGKVNDAAQQFLAADKATAKSSQDFALDQARVRVQVTKAADYARSQVSIDQQQLDALNALGEGLGLINTSVLTIPAALTELAGALANMAKASGSGQDLGRSPGVNAVLARATGYTGDFGSGGFQDYITGAGGTAANQAAARAVLTAFGQTDRIVGFATGGSFKVGGMGGIDSQLMSMRMTPGEFGYVSHEDPMALNRDLLGEFRTMRDEQKQLMLSVVRNTRRSQKALERALEGGPGFLVRSA